MAVPLFDNRTFEPLVEARVTDRVKSRLVSARSWRLVNTPERATVVIRGAVTAFGVTTVSFSADNRPLEQRISITADITTESKTDAPPLRVTLTGTAEYTETSDSLQTRTNKNRAIEEAGDGLAEALVARLDAHRVKKGPPVAPKPAETPAAP
ncbi:MAG: LPS assembly lipoprotein LptE [Nitrospirota bacterium]